MKPVVSPLRFEHRGQPVLSRAAFLRRLARSVLAGSVLVVVSLAAGIAGYHYLESLAWLDAFVNASMILSGMGPLANPQTSAGKLFAGCYALYSGLVVIIVAGVMFAPVIHRFMHKFHAGVDSTDGAEDDDAQKRPVRAAPKQRVPAAPRGGRGR